MYIKTLCAQVLLGVGGIVIAGLAHAQPTTAYPLPVEGDYRIKNFKFHTGEVFSELNMHYIAVGNPKGLPVLVLHGTAGTGQGMMTSAFAGELFGAGQPLDATRYFIILPDAIGVGKSSKPSDGLRTKFPKYNYSDMVDAQYRLVSEHFGLKHLRLVIGNSMGGMQTWIWAEKYPIMDVAVPMASLPIEMSGRNWMLRRLLIDSIRNDPTWLGGDYSKQPSGIQFASTFFGIATSGGSQAIYKAAPTREQADRLINSRLAMPLAIDANDYLYQWDASGDYNPSADIEKITATMLVINSADDERNPPELGLLELAMKRIKNGRAYIVPASASTAGHATTSMAKFWKSELAEILKATPPP